MVALHYVDDRAVVEIAAILGCAEGTVKAHLHQARRSLARTLGHEVGGPGEPARPDRPAEPAARARPTDPPSLGDRTVEELDR